MREEAAQKEMRRMLEWFKAQLPRHDLGGWVIDAQPEPPRIHIEEGAPVLQPGVSWTQFRIKGSATCQRCGARFRITDMGNALATDEESIPRVVEEMKAWVERDADKPCWGDVPDVRDDDVFVVPALDSMT